MWVNGELVAQNGRVGRTPEESFPGAYPLVAGFPACGDEVEVVLQYSNFTHSKGGIWTEIVFGTLKERTHELERALRAADAANRAKSEFFAVMSNEIRISSTTYSTSAR